MASSSLILTLITFISFSSLSFSLPSTTNTIPSSPTIFPFEDQISPEIAPLLPSPAATSSTQTIPSTNSTLQDPENDDVMADPDPAFAPSAPPPASSLATPSPQAPGALVFAAVSCFLLRLLAVTAL